MLCRAESSTRTTNSSCAFWPWKGLHVETSTGFLSAVTLMFWRRNGAASPDLGMTVTTVLTGVWSPLDCADNGRAQARNSKSEKLGRIGSFSLWLDAGRIFCGAQRQGTCILPFTNDETCFDSHRPGPPGFVAGFLEQPAEH